MREEVFQESRWDEVRGQVLLGEDGFVNNFKDLLEGKKEVKEIPRSQRYISRPSLEKIFMGAEGEGAKRYKY